MQLQTTKLNLGHQPQSASHLFLPHFFSFVSWHHHVHAINSDTTNSNEKRRMWMKIERARECESKSIKSNFVRWTRQTIIRFGLEQYWATPILSEINKSKTTFSRVYKYILIISLEFDVNKWVGGSCPCGSLKLKKPSIKYFKVYGCVACACGRV